MAHQAGFVTIIGRPNVGKSTLMNALVGEKLSIITHKAQTTRHRIFGIVSGENFQVVLSDTPGVIKPHYGMQSGMMRFVNRALEDADLFLLLTDPFDKPEGMATVLHDVRNSGTPVMLVINKMDLVKPEEIEKIPERWQKLVQVKEVLAISALQQTNMELLLERLIAYMPASPAFYPKDQITDQPERYFVSEIIREKILLQYKQEVPYSIEVMVEGFQEEEELIRILANIYVNKKSQKPILLGKGGQAIKKLGTAAREDIETFLGKQVYLELHVKIRPDWRDDPTYLKRFGYK
jgi:GTP-binding protein Era